MSDEATRTDHAAHRRARGHDDGGRARAPEREPVGELHATVGNQVVARMLGPPPPPRQPPPRPASRGSSRPGVFREAATGRKHTFQLPSVEIPGKIGLGPVKIDEAKAGGVVEWATPTPEGGTETATAGVVAGPGEAGLQAEFETRLKEKVGGYSLKAKQGAKATNKEMGVEFSIEGLSGEPEEAKWELTFTILGFEWEEGDVKLLESTLKIPLFKIPLGEIAGGQAEFKGSLQFDIGPDWGRLAQWAVERFGAQAATAIGLNLAMVGAAFATLAVYFNAIITAGELAERGDKAAETLRNACMAYEAVMRGQDAPGGEGSEIGSAHARKAIDEAEAPQPVTAAKARDRDLKGEAYAKILPDVRQKAIEAYWEEHWFERMMYGEEGAGAGGFRTFQLVLDASLGNAKP